MKPWVNEITYGNPTDNFLPYLQKGEFDFVFEGLKNYPFPQNGSDTTKDEIRELISFQNSPEQKDEEIMTRFLKYDSKMIDVFKEYCTNTIGHNMDEVIDQVIEDGQYVIVKLKFFYQRPRPFQLAHYYKARLFPYASPTAHTPAYPSGHAFQSTLLAEFIGNMHPEHSKFLNELAHDIAISRLFLGLHYATDNDFARFCATKMVRSKQFTSKYEI
jgi:hypothetical protein